MKHKSFLITCTSILLSLTSAAIHAQTGPNGSTISGSYVPGQGTTLNVVGPKADVTYNGNTIPTAGGGVQHQGNRTNTATHVTQNSTVSFEVRDGLVRENNVTGKNYTASQQTILNPGRDIGFIHRSNVTNTTTGATQNSSFYINGSGITREGNMKGTNYTSSTETHIHHGDGLVHTSNVINSAGQTVQGGNTVIKVGEGIKREGNVTGTTTITRNTSGTGTPITITHNGQTIIPHSK